ncbi:hypothetical protein A8990_11891 [Paenibacillus taihuensis]|uniref:Uncharacterized protein n=1 Tax=Paenibacillus taihuensis TaxID=1156355 RepID=A0A3D9RY27_9BACL|nr:hypothetical protein A8990_11891 [Paenibacillus taihuensis]
MMYFTGLASVTSCGIVYDSRMYSCQRAISEQWFSSPKHIGNEVPILFLEEDTSVIYLDNNTEPVDICREIEFRLFEGGRLTEYYHALDCIKEARRGYIQAGLIITSKGNVQR